MSLDWNVSQCPEKDFILSEDPAGYGVTKAIIFSLMDVGMRGIVTTDDVKEFLRRTAEIAEVRGGTMLQQEIDGEIVARPYTAEEVTRRLGLTANVGPMTNRQFTAKLRQVAKRVAQDATRR